METKQEIAFLVGVCGKHKHNLRGVIKLKNKHSLGTTFPKYCSFIGCYNDVKFFGQLFTEKN